MPFKRTRLYCVFCNQAPLKPTVFISLRLLLRLYNMGSNGNSTKIGETESSLEKIKRQLSSGSGRNILQGPLLKRSETLKKWNERWVILDPTTGKMEYKVRRNDTAIKGTMVFDANSTITVSPVNFHGLPKYDGCCIYIGTPQKHDHFLCAETPAAARAWVSTLQASQLVLRAHKEAVNSLTGNGSTKLGTVATVVAAANSTAMEATKEIEAAMKLSMRTALGLVTDKANEPHLDDLTIMKETLRVKDEELQQLAKELRARDSTIKEIAEKLTETAEAAQAAASAALAMDEERKLTYTEFERLSKNFEKQKEFSLLKLKESEEKAINLTKEKMVLTNQRDSAVQEAHLWRSELAKARDRAVVLEAAVLRAEERARLSEANAEARAKDAAEKMLAIAKEKDELLALVSTLQLQVQRQESNTKQVLEEKLESCSGTTDPDTKHMDSSEDDIDKACLSDSTNSAVVQRAVDGVEIDVREISPETESSSLDINVVSTQTEEEHQHINNNLQP